MRCRACQSSLEPHDEICCACGTLSPLGLLRAGGSRSARLPKRFLVRVGSRSAPPTETTRSNGRLVAAAILLLTIVGGVAVSLRASDPVSARTLAQAPRPASG